MSSDYYAARGQQHNPMDVQTVAPVEQGTLHTMIESSEH